MNVWLRLLVIVSALALTTLLLPSEGKAAEIQTSYNEGEPQFTLAIVGGDFDLDETHVVSEGVDWNVSVNISEDAGLINDALSINGTAQHIDPPHGEGVNPNIFTFNISVNADNFQPGAHSVTPVTATVAHGSHVDTFSASLCFTTATFGNLDDITGYTLRVTGVHTSGVPSDVCSVDGSVGGIAGLADTNGGSEPSAGLSRASTPRTASLIASLITAGTVAAGGAAWYARRRFAR